jgi:Tol biopolymer transport system component
VIYSARATCRGADAASRRRFALLLAGLVVAFGALTSSPAIAGEIVIWNNAPGPIYKANADGSNQTEVPLPRTDDSVFPMCKEPGAGECQVTSPSLAPDGSRISFSTLSGDLYTSDLEGASVHHVITSQKTTQTGFCYSQSGTCALELWWRAEWSPDGQWLVVEHKPPGATSIYSGSIWLVHPDGSDLHEVVNWGTAQQSPAFSPDGQRIVFTSWKDAPGNQLPRRSIYTSNLDGTDPRRITSQTDVDFENPTWGPSGILMDREQTNTLKNDIFGVQPDGTSLRSVTATPDAWEVSPDFSSTGRQVALSSYDPTTGEGIDVMNRDGTSRHRIVTGLNVNLDDIKASIGQGPRIGDGDDGDWTAATEAALSDYTPELRYSEFEQFRADDAAEITDNYVPRPGRAEYTNRLEHTYINGPSRFVAAADPALPLDDLSLDYLGSYDSGIGDAIDEGNNYAADATRMHNAGYGNRIYGRIVPKAGSDGAILQYWFFYYDNPKTFYGVGAHEGDWEMIQVDLDSTLAPTSATYAQHTSRETCSWDQVETDAARPVVYVAEGSHASYFHPGSPGPAFARDNADGLGEWVTDSTLVDITDPPGWLAWQGQWGGSDPAPGVRDGSPVSPMHQGNKWDDPQVWAAGSQACGE